MKRILSLALALTLCLALLLLCCAQSAFAEGENEGGDGGETLPEHYVDFTCSTLYIPLMSADYDLCAGMIAVDESGNRLNVEVADDGGFDPGEFAQFTVTYRAMHPTTFEYWYFRRTVETTMPEEFLGMSLSFAPVTDTICVGSSFSLEGNMKVTNENGAEVFFSVEAPGGFSVEMPARYEVSYVAQHPITGKTYRHTMFIYVLSKQDYAIWKKAHAAASGGEDPHEVYEYINYRNEIQDELTAAMDALTGELNARIELCASVFPEEKYSIARKLPLDGASDDDGYETVAMGELSIANWGDMLAVMVALSDIDVDKPMDLLNLRSISFDSLRDVFAMMVKLSYERTDEGLTFLIEMPSFSDVIDGLELDEARTELLYELMQPEFQGVFASITGNSDFAAVTDEEEAAIIASLPAGISASRQTVVVTAHSLVGKVGYFWGGKYNHIGWCSDWGIPKTVMSDGSSTTGKLKPYGLDCSGYVAWVFINAAQSESAVDAIGTGTAKQWHLSTAITREEAQPGDLVFENSPNSQRGNHVGIVVEVNADGSIMACHCNGDGVVVQEITEADFHYFRRPYLYGGDAQ